MTGEIEAWTGHPTVAAMSSKVFPPHCTVTYREAPQLPNPWSVANFGHSEAIAERASSNSAYSSLQPSTARRICRIRLGAVRNFSSIARAERMIRGAPEGHRPCGICFSQCDIGGKIVRGLCNFGRYAPKSTDHIAPSKPWPSAMQNRTFER